MRTTTTPTPMRRFHVQSSFSRLCGGDCVLHAFFFIACYCAAISDFGKFIKINCTHKKNFKWKRKSLHRASARGHRRKCVYILVFLVALASFSFLSFSVSLSSRERKNDRSVRCKMIWKFRCPHIHISTFHRTVCRADHRCVLALETAYNSFYAKLCSDRLINLIFYYNAIHCCNY